MLKPVELNLMLILACNLIISLESSSDCGLGFFWSLGHCVSCPEHCTSCSNGQCWWCKQFYWNVTARCEMRCPSNCFDPCDVPTGKCPSCKTGFYGDDCAYSCDSCIDKVCSDQRCKHGCKDGYYQETFQGYTNPICRECSSHCYKCENALRCDVCQSGFFLNEYISSGSVRSQCLTCSQNCSSCINVDRCTSCQHIAQSCKECKFNGTSYTCTQCESSYSLSNGQCYIEKTCSLNCVNGCETGGKCNQCKAGFSGYYCNETCNQACKTCTQENPNICDRCKNDFYTTLCNKPCNGNGNCLKTNGNSACDIETGICSKGCKPGYWGNYCEKNCSVNCLESESDQTECNRFNGMCLFGCKPNVMGLMCDLRITTTAHVSLKPTSAVVSLKSAEESNPEQLEESAKKNVMVGAVVGTLVGCLLIGAGSVAVFFIMKKRKRKSQSTRMPVYVNTIIDPVQCECNLNKATDNTEGLAESTVYQQLSNHDTGNEYRVFYQHKDLNQKTFTEIEVPLILNTII